ncbi:MAG: hypothetical protein R2713_02820 [Ilumatobacteraceae bacterium]
MLTLVVAGVASGRPDARADSRPADPTSPATPTTVTADALPTTQIDGVAWTQLVVGDTVFVGGRFSNARPAGAAPGTNLTPRSNFLAYDVRTGELIPTIAPAFNAQVRTIAASPDGTRLYVGGDFTNVDGLRRDRLAAFELPSMRLIGTFLPPVAYHVMALAVSPDNQTLYVGGNFSAVGSQVRNRLAAVRSDGALLSWAPNAQGGMVSAMVVSPDGRQVVVGGRFTSVNGSTNPGYGLASIDTTTGARSPRGAETLIRNGRQRRHHLAVDGRGERVRHGLLVLEHVRQSGGHVRRQLERRTDRLGGRLSRRPLACTPKNGVVYTVSRPPLRQLRRVPGDDATQLPPRSPSAPPPASSAATPRAATTSRSNPAPSELLWHPDLDQGHVHRPEPGSVERRRQWHLHRARRRVHPGELPCPAGARAIRRRRGGAHARGPAWFQNTWNNPTATSRSPAPYG